MISKKTKKMILIAVILSVIFLAAIIFIRLVLFKNSYGNTIAKTVIPTSSNQEKTENSSSESIEEPEVLTSFIPLLSTETLMNTMMLDFDGDNYEDQVIAIRKANSPYLFLVVGLYNPETNVYDRVAEIATEVTKERTFSYSNLDMTGEHMTALVYQGVKTNGDSVMKIFHCRRRRGGAEIINIGDFTSDGTIFILQSERSEAFELNQEKGKCFPVWVYSSDKNEEQNQSNASVSQIQTEYKWNEEEGKYTQSRQLRITGSRMAARELNRLLNGNVATFAQFLNGLWYKTTNTGSSPSYIYFNYESKEVIFLSEDTEGVYSWEDSSLRRSGIFLTTANTIISSMKRRFDIMLTDVNQVSIHVRDDVGTMQIREANQWDGTYKKLSFQSTFGETKVVYPHEEYLKSLTENRVWIDEDGRYYSFEANSFKRTSSEQEETGLFVMDTVGPYSVIQFRESGLVKSDIRPAYAIKYKTTQETIPAKRKGQKPTIKTVVDKDTILMTPVTLSPVNCYADEGKMITLKKQK